jgi:hypothetical protein
VRGIGKKRKVAVLRLPGSPHPSDGPMGVNDLDLGVAQPDGWMPHGFDLGQKPVRQHAVILVQESNEI